MNLRKLFGWPVRSYNPPRHDPNYITLARDAAKAKPERLPLDIYISTIVQIADQLWENTSPDAQNIVTQVFKNNYAAWLKPRLLVTFYPAFETREQKFRDRPMIAERAIFGAESVGYAKAHFAGTDCQGARTFDIMVGMLTTDDNGRTKYHSFPADSRTLIPWV